MGNEQQKFCFCPLGWRWTSTSGSTVLALHNITAIPCPSIGRCENCIMLNDPDAVLAYVHSSSQVKPVPASEGTWAFWPCDDNTKYSWKHCAYSSRETLANVLTALAHYLAQCLCILYSAFRHPQLRWPETKTLWSSVLSKSHRRPAEQIYQPHWWKQEKQASKPMHSPTRACATIQG